MESNFELAGTELNASLPQFVSSPVQVATRTNIINGYTVQDDSYVFIEWRSTTQGQPANLLIDGIVVCANFFTYSYSVLIPIKKGSVITFTGNIDTAFATEFRA